MEPVTLPAPSCSYFSDIAVKRPALLPVCYRFSVSHLAGVASLEHNRCFPPRCQSLLLQDHIDDLVKGAGGNQPILLLCFECYWPPPQLFLRLPLEAIGFQI